MFMIGADAAYAAEPPASILHLRSDTVVASDGTAVQSLHLETKVNNDAAARREAQQSLPYTGMRGSFCSHLR